MIMDASHYYCPAHAQEEKQLPLSITKLSYTVNMLFFATNSDWCMISPEQFIQSIIW